MPSYKVLAALVVVAIPAGLILTTTSTYNAQTGYTRPSGICGAFWKIESSGFPLFWRTESVLLGITKPCAAQFEADTVTYNWNAFSLDAAFYAVILYAGVFLLFWLRSRSKSYSSMVWTEQVDPP